MALLLSAISSIENGGQIVCVATSAIYKVKGNEQKIQHEREVLSMWMVAVIVL